MQPILVFDLDGTLAHTAPDLLATLNRVCAREGLSPVTYENIGPIVGFGARAMIKKVFALNRRSVNAERVDELFEIFGEDYIENIAVETRLFESIGALLPQLRDAGHTLCVCTNKRENMARVLLKALGIDPYFSALAGGDTFPFRKPDGRHILETVARTGNTQSSIIMIGDSAPDISAAKDAGVSSIAVTFGYSDQPVTELGATKIIDHFDQLKCAIAEIGSHGSNDATFQSGESTVHE